RAPCDRAPTPRHPPAGPSVWGAWVGLLPRFFKFTPRPQAHHLSHAGGPVSADAIASAAFGPVQRRVGQLHELNRITPIIRKRSNPNTNRDLVRTWTFGAPATDCGKIMLLDCRTHALSRDQ